MRNLFTRRRVAVGAAAAALLIGGGTVLAYWTSTGTGSGTAAVGTAANNLVVTGTADSTALTPGGPSSTVSFTVANPSSFNQKISNIHLASVQAYPTALDRTNATNLIAGCGTADFTMPDVAIPSNHGDITALAPAQALSEHGTLSMVDRADASPGDGSGNQDLCKGAFLHLTLSSS